MGAGKVPGQLSAECRPQVGVSQADGEIPGIQSVQVHCLQRPDRSDHCTNERDIAAQVIARNGCSSRWRRGSENRGVRSSVSVLSSYRQPQPCGSCKGGELWLVSAPTSTFLVRRRKHSHSTSRSSGPLSQLQSIASAKYLHSPANHPSPKQTRIWSCTSSCRF